MQPIRSTEHKYEVAAAAGHASTGGRVDRSVERCGGHGADVMSKMMISAEGN